MYLAAHATMKCVSRQTSYSGGSGEGGASVAGVATRVRVIGKRGDSLESSPNARVGSQVDDETLIREALAGKRWAEREVWYRFAPMVHGLLRRTLGARHEHDDLAQEVFIRVFRRLPSLENPSALRSFIYSIALRVVSEEIRHFYVLKRARENLEQLPANVGGSPVDFEARDLLLRVQRILDGMKDKHRAVFVLRHVEGMELGEIASGLDISLATVKRYLLKAMGIIERTVARDEGLRTSLLSMMTSRAEESCR